MIFLKFKWRILCKRKKNRLWYSFGKRFDVWYTCDDGQMNRIIVKQRWNVSDDRSPPRRDENMKMFFLVSRSDSLTFPLILSNVYFRYVYIARRPADLHNTFRCGEILKEKKIIVVVVNNRQLARVSQQRAFVIVKRRVGSFFHILFLFSLPDKRRFFHVFVRLVI